MARTPDTRVPKLGPWPLGINNLAPEGDLPRNEFGTRFIALREAQNVDLSKEGRLTRRPGYAGIHELELGHSLWSGPDMDFGLYVDNGQMHVLRSDESIEALGLFVGAYPLSYAQMGDRIFYTSRAGCGMLTLDTQAWSWGVEGPAGQPEVEAIDGYGLPPGQYQVAVTFTDVLGRESGTPRAVPVTVTEGQGILITGIPQPADPNVVRTNIYVTDANDQVLRRYAQNPSALSSAVITAQAAGVKLETQHLVPMPRGHIVRIHNGRQWVADGRNLRWSPTMRYGLTNPAEAVIRFDADIDMLEPVGEGDADAGIYVAAGSATYWFGGKNPAEFNKSRVSGHGAVPRSSVNVPGTALGQDTYDDVTVWLSRSGNYVLAGGNGKLTVLKASEAVMPDADSAASLFLARNGKKQIITTLRGARGNGLAVTDRAVAHVVHTPA